MGKKIKLYAILRGTIKTWDFVHTERNKIYKKQILTKGKQI